MSTPSRHRQLLYQWADELSQRLPLTQPQALGLALWSIGTVLARSGALTAVAWALFTWRDWPVANLAKRLREWDLEAGAKKGAGTGGRGTQRRDWQVAQVAPALGRWILATWPAASLALALDATTIQDRFTVLAISLVSRRGAIPLLWTVLPGNTPEAWQPHWERRLTQLAKPIGRDRFVLVLTDRGWYSPQLFRALVRVGWHPLMRIRAQGYYRPSGQSAWIPLAHLQPPRNQQQTWTGDAFKNTAGRLACTLVAWWTEGHAEPWLLLTDLAVDRVLGRWSGLRGWIEPSFQRLKSAGWNCEQTRMTTAARVERHWLALAVAMLWTVAAGGQAEAAAEAERAAAADLEADAELEALAAAGSASRASAAPAAAAVPEGAAARPEPQPAAARVISVFRRGWLILNQALAAGRWIAVSWHPEPLITALGAQAGFS